MKKFYFLFLSMCFLALQGFSQITNLHEWNFYGNTAKEDFHVATASNVFLESTKLTRGAAALGTSGYSNGFAATLLPGTTEQDAITNEFYFEFNVKAKTGSTVSLSSLFAQLRLQNTASYIWKYSVDGLQFYNVTSDAVSANAEVVGNVGVDQPEIDLSQIAALQNVPSTTTITFRLYVWGGTGANQGFGFGKSAASYNAAESLLTYKSSLVLKGEVKSDIQMLAGWDLSGLHDNIKEGSLPATSLDTNMVESTLLRGSAFTAGSLKYSYVSKIPVGENKDENGYFDITLKTKDSRTLNLESIDYLFRRNSAGAAKYSWTYSTDGTTFNDLVGESDIIANTNGEKYSVDLSNIAGLQNLSSDKVVTLRMHAWNANAEANVFGFGRILAGSVGVPGAYTIYVKGTTKSVTGINSDVALSTNIYIADNKLQVNSDSNKNSLLKVVNMAGKTVYSQSVVLTEGYNEFNLPQSLVKGVYVLTIGGQSVKFVK